MNAQPTHRIWVMPLVLGAAITVGLVSALLGDGIWNVISWAAMGIPLGISAWFAGPPVQHRPRSGPQE